MTANPLTLRQVESAIAHATGRRYQIDLRPLDERSLRELHRLLRDLEYDRIAEVNRVRRMPWRP